MEITIGVGPLKENILGSPFNIFVGPAETAALSCKSHHPSSVIAGETFDISIQTFDRYENPTDYEDDDVFLGWVEGDSDNSFEFIRVIDPSTKYKKLPASSDYIHDIYNVLQSSYFSFSITNSISQPY